MKNLIEFRGPGESVLWVDDKHIVRFISLNYLASATPLSTFFRDIAEADYKSSCGEQAIGGILFGCFVGETLRIPSKEVYPAYIDLNERGEDNGSAELNPYNLLSMDDVLEAVFRGIRDEIYQSFAIKLDDWIAEYRAGSDTPVPYVAILRMIRREVDELLSAPEAEAEREDKFEPKTLAECCG